MSSPLTLPELLLARATDPHSTAVLAFIDADGNISKSLTYADLLREASTYALRLLAAGLTPNDIVLGSFPDHDTHNLLFWACCLAGIPTCPLPPLHPDPSQQAKLFNHLQTLFHGPTLIAAADTVQHARALVPELKALVPEHLPPALQDASGIFPARHCSPSERVCLMLTSGSTGNSKAVVMRHSTLLSGVRARGRRLGITSASRILNWIAFDHVACLSDGILQGLDANASQWHASPSATVRNPLNLVKWISTLGITFTFSPNFLLAQILRDIAATPSSHTLDLSTLRTLTSGGEASPLSTAIAFSDLLEKYGGRRDVLVAGFGMSETGAGCIYNTHPVPRRNAPDLPKYLPLGTCSDGIQMRVVDTKTGRECAPDEPGQFQVKGPSVFSEYYGNRRATEDSFSEDGWFITGDLARLDEEGNLFLVGREKDCVNINGVKHPTHDVEHYIEDARIDGVTHSYVYVCPMRLANADTETYAVFYQHRVVVEAELEVAQRRAVAATSRAIKNACTVFCSQAPHVVLPLPRVSSMKTSLGKVSRWQLSNSYLRGDLDAIQAALEVKDSAPVEDAVDELRNPVEQVVAGAIASIFFVEPSTLRRSQNIFDLGASSMHLIRLKQLCQDRLSLPNIPTIEMLKRPEIGQLCDYISELAASGDRDERSRAGAYQPLVCLHGSGSKPPVFFVHPGVGEVLVFVGLARLLADDRPVYALRARGFERGETTFTTFEEMVDTYASAIARCYPSGPYYVAGYSYGGAVAFDVGKRLESRGGKVAWLGILNLPPYIQARMSELNWSEVLLNLGMFLSLTPSSSLDDLRRELQEKFPDVTAVDAEPRDSRAPIEWMFTKSDEKRLVELDLRLEAFAKWVKVAYEINSTGRTFVPDGCVVDALTTVFCAIPLPSMGTRLQHKRRLSAWRDFSGELFEMVDVDGEHYTMLDEMHVESFAKKLRGALERADLASALVNG